MRPVISLRKQIFPCCPLPSLAFPCLPLQPFAEARCDLTWQLWQDKASKREPEIHSRGNDLQYCSGVCLKRSLFQLFSSFAISRVIMRIFVRHGWHLGTLKLAQLPRLRIFLLNRIYQTQWISKFAFRLLAPHYYDASCIKKRRTCLVYSGCAFPAA